MLPGQTVSGSLLDKPLHQLTEDDISQVTREDCRRYLKQKGMRRPSWNKSQAIQQVISLKTLLETTSDSNATEPQKKLYIPRPQLPTRGTSADTRFFPSADETAPYLRQDTLQPVPLLARFADNDSVSPRNTCAANEPGGQMTIFYCGKVSVYDDVPNDKAQTIMQLAGSPLSLPQEALCNVTTPLCSTPCHLQAEGVKIGPSSPMLIFPSLETECQNSRKASVQRYLGKRKDRFKIEVETSASLDMYLNHRMGDQISNEHFNWSDKCSPPEARPSHTPTHYCLLSNIAISANCPANLNDKGVKIYLTACLFTFI
ncbi:tify domain-containing protein/CCT_2 domain-containing protein [Cephalotus follicularis]|uniref:Protein TIFY n=1 Tax=Cephalotus follicularis TaxID=3775 RepID=A0A1Q3D4M6_CEPFO|nr:tify domain-containing protein/CCT_2 domain-containing protein [Cephalotus follicularis]